MKKISLCVIVLVWLLSIAPAFAQANATVTLLHFSDYHSHATDFYSESQAHTAGIARLIAYLQPYAKDPDSLIFNGGDMLNIGTAWSDKYHCAEWPWLNGIVDAMAYGNHDADYGAADFAACKDKIDYPILSSNTLDAQGQPFFQSGGKTYKVFTVNDVKIGVFALAGPDFSGLIKPEMRPATGVTFGDRLATARQVVTALRDQEHVNAVVLIGHALREDDIALAQAVPGIDIIFGTHSHRKEDLFQIPNTNTWMISPFQYATYVSKLELHFSAGTLTGVTGGLARLDQGLQPEPRIVQKVDQMQSDLQNDPKYASLFHVLGSTAVELSTNNQFTGEGLLGDFVMDLSRNAAQAQMALATASGFREPIPPGPIDEATLLSAIPYKNAILVYTLTGAQIQQLLDFSISRSGSDFFSQVSGVRFVIADGHATNIQLLRDPAHPDAGYAALDPAASYAVATTDFQGKAAGGYKDIFAEASFRETGIADIRDLVRDYLKSYSPINVQLDGRISAAGEQPISAPVPAQLPNTGTTPAYESGLTVLAAILIGVGACLLYGVQRRKTHHIR